MPARWLASSAVFACLIAAAAGTGAFDVSTTKGHENHAVLFSKWNSFSRIGVYDQPYGAWSLSNRYTGPLPETRLMDIDSAAGTQILRFNGDLSSVSYLRYELTALGRSLWDPVDALGAWARAHQPEIEAARQRFDARADETRNAA